MVTASDAGRMSESSELMIIICAEISAIGVRMIDSSEIMPKLFDISGAVATTQAVEIMAPFATSRRAAFRICIARLIGAPTKIIAITAIKDNEKLNSKRIVGSMASIINAVVQIEFCCE